MVLWLSRVAVLVGLATVARCAPQGPEGSAGLEQQLSVLSKQVTALLERREEDLKSIEDSIRREIFDSSELLDLKDEVRTLRNQLEGIPPDTIKNVNNPSQNAQNEEVTVKWLSNVVNELKMEISELQESLNSSTLQQTQANTEAEITIFKSDIANLNQELEISRKKNVKYETELLLLREELESTKDNWKHTSVSCGEVQNQFKAIQNEWRQNKNLLIKNDQDELNQILLHPSRHHKILRNHVIRLEETSRRLQKESYVLKNKLNQLELGLENHKYGSKDSIQEFDRINGNEIQNYIESNKIFKMGTTKNSFYKKFENLTNQQNVNTKVISNLTKKISDLDKLHLSTLELLENVENLENKVDNSFPEFRREISKLEIQINEITSEVSSLKEDQKNIKESMKAISFSVSTLQEKTNSDHETLDRQEEHIKILEKSTSTQASSLHNHILKAESSTANINATKSTIHMVEELRSFENEYKSIVNKLPRDCGNVDGPSGIYLISPGDSGPILAYCDNGWTTFQKRYDGSINFNRNWDDYSNGFGSVTGEHWLGNKHLNLLTRENCTKLQINMKDIYGKYWQANYDDFRVLDFTQGFKLSIDKYNGNASDAFNYQNNMEFSTIDDDRDVSNTHCASNYEGGWWFSHCQQANLNGRFNLGLTWFDSFSNEWIAVSQSEMRLKRRDVC